MDIKVNDTIDNDARVLPAILEVLPNDYTAWVSGGNALIYNKDVEIASVSVRGLEPDEAAEAVRKELKGVI